MLLNDDGVGERIQSGCRDRSPPCVCLGKIEGASVTDCVRVSFLKYRDREGQTTNPRRQDANKIETAHSLLHTTLRKQYMKRDDQSLIPRKKSK